MTRMEMIPESDVVWTWKRCREAHWPVGIPPRARYHREVVLLDSGDGLEPTVSTSRRGAAGRSPLRDCPHRNDGSFDLGRRRTAYGRWVDDGAFCVGRVTGRIRAAVV